VTSGGYPGEDNQMPPHHVARLRLVAMTICVTTFSAAIAALDTVTVKGLQGHFYSAYRGNVLVSWLAISVVPPLLVTPLIGLLAASGRTWAVLVGGTGLSACLLGWSVYEKDTPWLSCVGVVSLAAAFVFAAVLALIPQVARATRLPVHLIYTLLTCAGVGGLAFGADLGMTSEGFAFDQTPRAANQAFLLTLPAFLAAGFCRFQVGESVSVAGGMLGSFAAGVRDSFKNRRAVSALIGLFIWFFVTTAVVVVLVRQRATGFVEENVRLDTLNLGFACLAGIVCGIVQRNPYRHAGLAFFASFLVAACCLWLRFADAWDWPLLGLGFALGLSLPPLLNFYQTWTTTKYHGVAASLVVAGCCIAALALAGVLANLGDDPLAARTPLLNILVTVTILACAGSIVAFFRPGMEGFIEGLLWPAYRIKSFGPGVEQLPPRGPYLVIANHSAWLDPLFMAKILPAPTTPMMTSKFYDLPVISFLMRNAIGTIRVPETTFRHDAPELKEAVAALDAGKCLVVFAEGYLRRKEEQPLRRFGRGAWKILSERPTTPVFACWIEGNWGSFFSHRGGPPMKGKRFDFWRKIRIGVLGPITMDAAILKDHMATRTFLMQQVAAARLPLGLTPLELPMVAEGEKE
jgi:1-acyl-sn-glycerol-3-phosphate acyltransferase